LLKKPLPVYYLLLCLCIVALPLLAFFVVKKSNLQGDSVITGEIACQYTFPRLNGYQYVKPLLSAERSCESDRLIPYKNEVETQIAAFKTAGLISSCSVYVRDLKDESWITINPAETYDPASLLKIAVMATVLRVAEDSADYLQRRIFYNEDIAITRTTYFTGRQIQKGQWYTVSELLRYMICYSDNNATGLLVNLVGIPAMAKTHQDLGLPMAGPNQRPASEQVSHMLDVLFNVGYLTIKDSEYACTLLAQSDFKLGIIAGLPEGIKVIHKFGEGGGPDTGDVQLHESAIIYLSQGPVLLTIMTKGKDLLKEADVIKQITQTTYKSLSAAS
jgi:beta-lactamase class A